VAIDVTFTHNGLGMDTLSTPLLTNWVIEVDSVDQTTQGAVWQDSSTLRVHTFCAAPLVSASIRCLDIDPLCRDTQLSPAFSPRQFTVYP
jgi:hypothetical protein